MVWDERIKGSDKVVVHLGNTYPSVRVYDPTVGTTPIESHRDIDSLALTLSDHPVIIAIPAGAGRADR